MKARWIEPPTDEPDEEPEEQCPPLPDTYIPDTDQPPF